MDVSLATALLPATFSNRYGAGSTGSAQATAAALDQASSKTDAPGFSALQAGLPEADGIRNSPSQNHLDQAIKQVNDAFNQKGQNLYASFEEDKITGIQVVKIVEKETNEIIRQMPSKEMVAFAQSLEVEQGWLGRLILAKA